MNDTAADQSDTKSLLLDSEHPWPGLNAFTEANAAFFFGREQEVEDLARMVRQQTVTVFYGKSGLGKSSLLRAGLAPLLSENNFVPVYVRLNHIEEKLPLEDQVEVHMEGVIADQNIEAPQPVREETLWEYFHKKGSDWWGSDNQLLKPVLIFDQFEELLTTGQETPLRAQRCAAFLTELEDLVENRPPASLLERFRAERGLAKNYDLERVDYRVVLAVREDYLADFEGLRERLRQIMLNRYRLLPMNGEQALNVVLKPGSHLVDDDAALRIVDFVSSANPATLDVEISREDIAGRQVEPALLSVVLRELNNRRIQSGGDLISADIVANSRPADILANFYERGLEGLDDEVREFIERRLLTASGARNRVAEEDAVSRYGVSESDIAALIDRRIIQRDSTGQMKWLELTHDSLAEVVRDNRKVSRQRRELEATEAREKEAQRKLARTRKLAGSFAVLALLAAASSIYAYKKHSNLVNRAEREANDAVIAIRKELRDQSPGGGSLVTKYLADVTSDANEFGTDHLNTRLLIANTLAAEKYFSIGKMSQGIATTEESSRLLGHLRRGSMSAGDREHMRARIAYLTGLGQYVTGSLPTAQSNFLDALEIMELLIGAGENTNELIGIYELRAAAMAALGKSQLSHGRIDEAIESFDQVDTWSLDAQLPVSSDARDLWHLWALRGLGLAQDSEVEAVGYFRQARDILRAKIDENPHQVVWSELDAEFAFQSAIKMTEFAKYHVVARHSRDAVSKSKTLYGLDRDNLLWSLLYAQSLRASGQLHDMGKDEVRKKNSFELMLAISEDIAADQPEWVDPMYVSAVAKFFLGSLEEWPTAHVEARKLFAEMAGSTEVFEYHRSFALQLGVIGNLYRTSEENPQYEMALGEFQRALDAMDSIPARVRSRPRYKEMTAWLRSSMGHVFLDTEDFESATDEFTQALQLQQEILGETNDLDVLSNVSKNLLWLGNASYMAGRSEKAAQYYTDGIATIDNGLSEFPGNPLLVEQKIRNYWHILDKFRDYGDWEASVEQLERLVETATQSFQRDPLQVGLYRLLDSVSQYCEEYDSKIENEIEALGESGGVPMDITALRSRLGSAANKLTFRNLIVPVYSEAESTNPPDFDISPDEQSRYLMSGDWNILSADEMALEKTSNDLRATIDEITNGGFDQNRILRIHSLPLSFYENSTLYQADIALSDGGEGALNYIRHPDGITHVGGSSPPIHELNATGLLTLESWQRASDYLHFFFSAIQGERGTFRIVQKVDDIPLEPNQDREYLRELNSKLIPIVFRESHNGEWDVLGPVVYDDSLFIALFRVSPNGMIEMIADSPIAGDLPVRLERYVNGIRRLTDQSEVVTDWAGEVRTYQDTIAAILASDADNKAELLRGQYLGLSWYQLHTRDFLGALDSVEEGYKWNPDLLVLDTNKAHALLFLGRSDEADEIYLRNIGQEVVDKTWRQAILDDFDDFEEAGIVNEEFARIRELINNAGAQ